MSACPDYPAVTRTRPGAGRVAAAVGVLLVCSVAAPGIAGCELESSGEVVDLYGGLSEADRGEIAEVVLASLSSSDATEARFWEYLCPDVGAGGCTIAAFRVDGACVAAPTPHGGACYDTGLVVRPGQELSLESCSDASCSSCGEAFALDVPELLWSEHLTLPGSVHCGTACEAPASCPPEEG